MRITKYKLALQSEGRIPCLVKENAENYPYLSGATNPQDAVRVANAVFNANLQPEEHCYMIAFRTNRIVGVFEVSHGIVNSALITPKEVFTRLLLSSATDFIILHNHPSGNAVPSKCDIEITKKLRDAGKIIGIKLFDHIIIGESDWDYYSFAVKSDLLKD